MMSRAARAPERSAPSMYPKNGTYDCSPAKRIEFRNPAFSAGAIVVTASVAGVRPRPKLAAYCASKGGVIALAKTLALEVGEYGIRVVPVCPVATDTPMLAELSREALTAAAHTSSSALGATGRDPWIACLTPAHAGGMMVLLRGLLSGKGSEVRGQQEENYQPSPAARSAGKFHHLSIFHAAIPQPGGKSVHIKIAAPADVLGRRGRQGGYGLS